MKRLREGDDINIMANYLVSLSGQRDISRLFTCKTCDKKFTSFQALGGHRASHKKPRLAAGDDQLLLLSPPKPKSHECSICGLEFPMGQALGGHMRRHRSTPPANIIGDDHHLIIKHTRNRPFVCLDLNLTPLENMFVFGLFVN